MPRRIPIFDCLEDKFLLDGSFIDPGVSVDPNWTPTAGWINPPTVSLDPNQPVPTDGLTPASLVNMPKFGPPVVYPNVVGVPPINLTPDQFVQPY